MRGAVVLLALAGCDHVLGLTGVPDARIDAPPDAPPPPCVTPLFQDSFDTAPPCATWGFVDNSTGTVSLDQGRLSYQPQANNNQTHGGCISSDVMPFHYDSGAFIESSTPASGGEYKQLILYWQGTSSFSMIAYGLSTVYFQNETGTTLGMVPFDPVTTRWMRMRPLADGSAVVAEYARDGRTWLEFARDPRPAPAFVRVYVYGGTFTALPAPPPITFETFDVCP